MYKGYNTLRFIMIERNQNLCSVMLFDLKTNYAQLLIATFDIIIFVVCVAYLSLPSRHGQL